RSVAGCGVEPRAPLAQRVEPLAVGLAVDLHGPAGRVVEAEDHAHGRGLARAVRPQESGHLAGPHSERQVVHRRGLAVALGQVGCLNRGHGSSLTAFKIVIVGPGYGFRPPPLGPWSYSPGLTSADSYATITAWARSRTCSLANRLVTWFLTVEGETPSSAASSALDRPRAIQVRISRSRSVSASTDRKSTRLNSS